MNDEKAIGCSKSKGVSSGPLVSIIIPYYMQKPYIRETVSSALGQTYANIEVIVVDDGSPVPAEPCLEGLGGIRLFRTDNHGCPATRNYGFRQSTGDYVLFLDGDDLLSPDAVEAHLQTFAKTPEAGLSFGALREIDEDGRPMSGPKICRPRADYFMLLLALCPLQSPGATLMRREAFEEAGMFSISLPAQVDDYDLYLRLARRWPFVRHTSCVLNYRLHGNNISRDRERMLAGTLAVLDNVAATLPLTSRERRRLRYGRRRAPHDFRPEPTLEYRFMTLFYRVQQMMGVAPRYWFEK